MGKYENDVKQLLTLIGGKENIQAVPLHDKDEIRPCRPEKRRRKSNRGAAEC